MIKDIKDLKIAVVHDHLGFPGGGERAMLILALDLGVDFITAYANPDTFSGYQKKLRKKLITFAKNVIYTRGVRFFWLRLLYLQNRKIFKNYDILIASGQSAVEAVAKYARPKATKIVYTHTPPRRIFDQYTSTIKKYPLFLRPAYFIFARFWKYLYLNAIKRFDINIANSENIRKRIQTYTNGDVNAVIWPPIETDKFKWIGQGNYFLSWGRIDEAKRIELIAKAFVKMPDKKLIIASSGPLFTAVKEIVKNSPNIKMTGWISDEELKKLVGECQAAIYIPIDEDAGMTHLEANSAGKPVLGVKEGGLLESIIDYETGILIQSDPDEEDIINGIQKMTPEWCLARKEKCEMHAQKYDEKIFNEKMRAIIENNNPSIPLLGIDASRWEDPRFPGEDRRTGVEVYSKHLIENLIKRALNSELRVRIYTPRLIQSLPLAIQKVIPFKKQWTRKGLADELKYSPPDYFFTPSYYIPDSAPKKSFAVIHDIIFKTSPEKYSLKQRLNQGYALRKNIKNAQKIITISDFSKQEIIKEYGLDPEKIIVVPIGFDALDLNTGKTRKPEIVYIGRIETKKSVNILVKAFAEVKKTYPEWKLILAGGFGFGADNIKDIILELHLSDDIIIPGYITEEHKWEMLTEASLFVHPSSNEGSCLPLFEAWNAKIPAIVSDAPVLREVGKNGTLYFKAEDEKDLAEKIKKLISNEELRKDLISRGEENLKTMSWEKTAEEVLSVILADAGIQGK